MLTLSFQSEEESLQGFLGRMFKLQKLGVCIHRFNLLWNYSNLAENDTEHYNLFYCLPFQKYWRNDIKWFQFSDVYNTLESTEVLFTFKTSDAHHS